jgi:hypothetical protein
VCPSVVGNCRQRRWKTLPLSTAATAVTRESVLFSSEILPEPLPDEACTIPLGMHLVAPRSAIKICATYNERLRPVRSDGQYEATRWEGSAFPQRIEVALRQLGELAR